MKRFKIQLLRVLVVCFIVLFPVLVPAQETENYKIEKVKPSDFELNNEVIDEYSHAVYIYNIGECEVVYTAGNDAGSRLKVKSRVKVLKKEGLSHADVVIPLWIGKEDRENIISVNGGVYNLVNGKVEFEKLKNSDWFVEERSNDNEVVRIAFKNARVGSIIELEYYIFSPFVLRPRDWDFQLNDAPVIYSEYEFSSPQEMGYGMFRRDWLGVIKPPIVRNNVLGVARGVGQPNYYKVEYTFVAENVPSMRREPHMNSMENYRSTVVTELKYTAFRQGDRKYYFQDWKTSAEDFSVSNYNGDFLSPKDKLGFYQSPFANDSLAAVDTLQVVNDIYDYVSTQYSVSDDIDYLSATRSPKELLSINAMSKNEINWLLVATLKANGIDAYPVLFSERNQAKVREDIPIFTQFDDLIAIVEVDGINIFLDATDPTLEMGDISENSYNGTGFILDQENYGWVEMKGAFETYQKCGVEIDQFEDGILKGQMNLTLSGIYASRMLRFLQNNDHSDIHQFLNIHEKTQIKLVEEPDLSQMQPLILKFEISAPADKFGDSYLIDPVLFDPQVENPMEDSERKYPVNFPSTWSESYTCLIRLDQEKYDVTVPEPVKYGLPNMDGSFMFAASYNLGNLLIRSKVEMNKTTYSTVEYPAVRELYNLISAAHLSNIEIKIK